MWKGLFQQKSIRKAFIRSCKPFSIQVWFLPQIVRNKQTSMIERCKSPITFHWISSQNSNQFRISDSRTSIYWNRTESVTPRRNRLSVLNVARNTTTKATWSNTCKSTVIAAKCSSVNIAINSSQMHNRFKFIVESIRANCHTNAIHVAMRQQVEHN